jgi:glutathione S-transferase
MLTLIQFSWSPFCITIRRIMERNKVPFRIQNIAYHEREKIIQATHGHGHTVPCLIDDKRAVCDVTDFGQEVARYLDKRFRLGLFPEGYEGIQFILSRYIENDLEMVGFKVNDSYVIPSRPLVERVMLTRHKERKFGRGCIKEWISHRAWFNAQFVELLKPMENVLSTSSYLLGERPYFVDYDLYGVIGNYLYSGKTKLPNLTYLRRWYRAMSKP